MQYDSKSDTLLSDCVFYQFIEDDLPEKNALCDLDCREHQCTELEWIICRRRLNTAKGELMPVIESV